MDHLIQFQTSSWTYLWNRITVCCHFKLVLPVFSSSSDRQCAVFGWVFNSWIIQWLHVWHGQYTHLFLLFHHQLLPGTESSTHTTCLCLLSVSECVLCKHVYSTKIVCVVVRRWWPLGSPLSFHVVCLFLFIIIIIIIILGWNNYNSSKFFSF